MFKLLPVAVLVAFIGFIHSAYVLAFQDTPSRALLQQSAQATAFVVYRNAVVAFVTANPNFAGTVQPSSLALPPGFAALPGQGNQVAATASGAGRIIYTWATLPVGAARDAEETTGGDLSYGTVTGSTWTNSAIGVVGTLGIAIPNGDIVSVLQLGV